MLPLMYYHYLKQLFSCHDLLAFLILSYLLCGYHILPEFLLFLDLMHFYISHTSHKIFEWSDEPYGEIIIKYRPIYWNWNLDLLIFFYIVLYIGGTFLLNSDRIQSILFCICSSVVGFYSWVWINLWFDIFNVTYWCSVWSVWTFSLFFELQTPGTAAEFLPIWAIKSMKKKSFTYPQRLIFLFWVRNISLESEDTFLVDVDLGEEWTYRNWRCSCIFSKDQNLWKMSFLSS